MEAYFKTSNKRINLRLILVYAPTEDKDDEVKNENNLPLHDERRKVVKIDDENRNVAKTSATAIFNRESYQQWK